MKVNVSEGKPNFSQRNNEFTMTKSGIQGTSSMQGNCMCNVTSVAMAAFYAGYEFPKGSFEQPEDNLGKFICTNPEIDEMYKRNFPGMYKDWVEGKKNAYWPNEIHLLLAAGFNKWMGKDIAKFYEGLPLNQYIGALVDGIAIPTSMNFGPLGHIICVVGFETSADEAFVKRYIAGEEADLPADTKIIFDDPFGYCYDFEKGLYKQETGNDRTMTLAQFIKHSKPLGDKKVMCHVLQKLA